MLRANQSVPVLLALTASASSCLAQTSRPDEQPLDTTPCVDVPLPDPITEAEIIRYSATLGLGEAQSAAFQAYYASYLEQDRELRSKELPTLSQQAREVAALSGLTATDVAAARMHADLVALGEAFAEKCRGNERSLFALIEPMLAELQLPALQRVGNQRTRAFCANSLVLRQAAKVDLSLLIWELSRETPIGPVDPPAFESLLSDYEAAAAHIAINQYRTDRARSREASVLRASREREPLDENRSRVAVITRNRTILKQIIALNRKPAREEQKLERLNRLYADLLADLLPEPVSDEFMRRFREQAYPEVYPDPYDISSVLESASAIPSLSPEQREFLDLNLASFEDRQSAINDRMVDRVTRWFDEYAQHGATKAGTLAEFKADVDKLHSTRLESADSALSTLLEAFNSSLPSEVRLTWEEYLRSARGRQPVAMGLSYQPESDLEALLLLDEKVREQRE